MFNRSPTKSLCAYLLSSIAAKGPTHHCISRFTALNITSPTGEDKIVGNERKNITRSYRKTDSQDLHNLSSSLGNIDKLRTSVTHRIEGWVGTKGGLDTAKKMNARYSRFTLKGFCKQETLLFRLGWAVRGSTSGGINLRFSFHYTLPERSWVPLTPSSAAVKNELRYMYTCSPLCVSHGMIRGDLYLALFPFKAKSVL